MAEGVIIAIITSIGLIVVAYLQARTNRNNAAAAEAREKALKEQHSQQLALEREERKKEREHAAELAAADRKHELTKAHADHQRELGDKWRQERILMYENTIAAAHSLGRLAGEMFANLNLNKDVDKFQEKNSAFVRSLTEITSSRGGRHRPAWIVSVRVRPHQSHG